MQQVAIFEDPLLPSVATQRKEALESLRYWRDSRQFWRRRVVFWSTVGRGQEGAFGASFKARLAARRAAENARQAVSDLRDLRRYS